MRNAFQLHRQWTLESINIEHVENIRFFVAELNESVKIYEVYLSHVIVTIFIKNISLNLQEICECVSGFSKHFYKHRTVMD